MLILQGWLVSTSSPSHTFLLKLSRPSADRGNGITVVSFYCCCLSKGAYIESNFPLKGANCSQKIVTAIARRWLAASSVLAAKNGRISYAGGERKKKGAVDIKRCVVKNECEISHAPDDENGCCFARWRGNINLMCICWCAKRLRWCVVRWGDAGFLISYNVGPSEPLRVAICLHVLQLCKDQEDLFLLAACPSP